MLGFRSFFTTHRNRDQLMPLIREQVDRWMRSQKGWDPTALVTGGIVTIAAGVRGMVLEHTGQDGSSSSRLRIVETKADGRWVVQVTTHLPAARDRAAWGWIDVEGPDPADVRGRSRRAKTPRFVNPLLDVIDAWDGSARLSTRPQVIRGTEAREVLNALVDTERRGMLFVAGSDDLLPIIPWTNLVAKLTRFTHGVAAAYVLDGEATRILNDSLGPTHTVAPGRVRSFRPQIQPQVTADSHRHRVLSPKKVLEDGEHDYIARVLAANAHRQSCEQPLPAPASRVHRMLERLEDELLVHRLGNKSQLSPLPLQQGPGHGPARAVAEQQASPRSSLMKVSSEEDGLILEYLKAKLNLPDVDADVIDEIASLVEAGRQTTDARSDVASRLEQLQNELGEAETVNRDLVHRLEDEQLETSELLARLTIAEETIRRLRGRLAEAGRIDIAWTEQANEIDLARPDSFAELLKWLPRLQHVVFTGDDDETLELDSIDPLGSWASLTWDALLVLEDYAAARLDGRWDRDVNGFLLDTPAGCHQWPARRHARDESEEVRKNPSYWKPRVFPVPSSVDTNGEAFMGAHFKIAKLRTVSPRMHYFDDVTQSRKVYVGYIGCHLPTGMTN